MRLRVMRTCMTFRAAVTTPSIDGRFGPSDPGQILRIVRSTSLLAKPGPYYPFTTPTTRVHVKVVEGEKERVQVFEGLVIRRRGEGARATFTVRRVSYGVGVERTFPVHSPRVDRIQVMKSGHVRRSKLYYLRERAGKAARLREKRVIAPTG